MQRHPSHVVMETQQGDFNVFLRRIPPRTGQTCRAHGLSYWQLGQTLVEQWENFERSEAHRGSWEQPGQLFSVGVPKTCTIQLNCSSSDLAGKSGSCNSNSARMHPTDHMSVAGVYSRAPRNTSGGLATAIIKTWEGICWTSLRVPRHCWPLIDQVFPVGLYARVAWRQYFS